jgi:hypothetical protein
MLLLHLCIRMHPLHFTPHYFTLHLPLLLHLLAPFPSLHPLITLSISPGRHRHR